MNITIKNLQKHYKNKLILDIEELKIESNKITGIVGENGAGKSTLLNIISGIDKDFSGQVYYDSKKLDDEIKKEITLVFQKPRLLNDTVYKNMSYPLKIRKIKKENIKLKTEQILKSLGIENLKYKKALELSGGEQQKVALARALVFNPKVLILDEATANIDFESKREIENIIMKYNKDEKNTIILVSHDEKIIKSLCHNIIVLNKLEEN